MLAFRTSSVMCHVVNKLTSIRPKFHIRKFAAPVENHTIKAYVSTQLQLRIYIETGRLFKLKSWGKKCYFLKCEEYDDELQYRMNKRSLVNGKEKNQQIHMIICTWPTVELVISLMIELYIFLCKFAHEIQTI